MLRHLPIHQCKYGSASRSPTKIAGQIYPQIIQIEYLRQSGPQRYCRIENSATKGARPETAGYQAKTSRQTGERTIFP
jgi:hypothetical protein